MTRQRKRFPFGLLSAAILIALVWVFIIAAWNGWIYGPAEAQEPPAAPLTCEGVVFVSPWPDHDEASDDFVAEVHRLCALSPAERNSEYHHWFRLMEENPPGSDANVEGEFRVDILYGMNRH